MTSLPIVDPELDPLAFRAFYLLQTLSISLTGSPPYDDVDVLARAGVLPRYTPLLDLLIKKIHPVTGFALSMSPHNRRAPRAVLICGTMPIEWLDRLDRRIVEVQDQKVKRMRPQIAAHPNASGSLWDAMLSRGEPTIELIQTIQGARAEERDTAPQRALARARQPIDVGEYVFPRGTS